METLGGGGWLVEWDFKWPLEAGPCLCLSRLLSNHHEGAVAPLPRGMVCYSITGPETTELATVVD